MVVQHNISAMNANRYYNINNSGLSKSLEKLSSGYQINRAGDNAAGLAVSEKMRSQIGGLTQGVKNAQDGISMIQTFEGALTETDSILQRMKTLADQAANGTYQDDVDREAIQLEFNQLNDELNQIADTDFNGVVMLNGGVMADGLKQVAGEFDYANKESQLMDEAKELRAADLTEAQTAYNAAKAAFEGSNYDLSDNGNSAEWNTLDQNNYTKDNADALWVQLGIVKTNDDGTTKLVDGASVADTSSVNEISITFTFNGTSWAATSAVDNNNKTYSETDLSKVKTTSASVADTTGYGGFSVDGTSVNALFDATNAKKGDTVTITFTNDKENIYAPNNIGLGYSSVSVSENATGLTAGDITVSLGGVTDGAMTADIKSMYDALEGAEISAKYTASTETKEGSISDFTIAGQKLTETTGTTGNITINGQKIYYSIKTDATGGSTVTFATAEKGGLSLATVHFSAADAKGTAADKSQSGTISAKLDFGAYDYEEASTINATPGKNSALGTSKDAKEAMEAAKEKLNEISSYTIDDLESAKAYLNKKGVSVADAYDQSTTTLTYTDNLSLQAGARTKDLVNFTFQYASNGLGDLEANMNCSSRTDGLGTADLSLLTQKDANAAIDKIDNAINKVSMIRATFGATQNRLEHKIDNMNVTKENITSAESRIRDTDINEEMANFTKNQILSQASQSMLAQANSLPQNVLQLLG